VKEEASEIWHNLPVHGDSYGIHWMAAEYHSGLVSIVIPTYNRANFLLDCLRSVLDQTYRPIEIILVDDGSTDSTSAVVERWRASLTDDAFIFVFIRQENQGANVARNRALLRSRGEYIQFLDSDDVLLPTKLSRGVSAIRSQHADFAYCPVLFRDEKLRAIPGSFGKPMSGNDSDITTYLWQTMCPVYSRHAVRAIGPWMESIFFADDWEYATRTKLLGFQGFFDDMIGGFIRVYARQERSTHATLLREAADSFQAYQHITELAARLNRLSGKLSARLANRFLIASLQFGRCGDFDNQRHALEVVMRLAPKKSLARRIAVIWPKIPSTLLPGIALNVIKRAQRFVG